MLFCSVKYSCTIDANFTDVVLVWEFSSYTFEETFSKIIRIVKAEGTSTELQLSFGIQAVQPDIENFATFGSFERDATFGMFIIPVTW